jgi:hypothetical protein
MTDTRYNMVVTVRGKERQLAETGDIGQNGAFKISWKRWY